MSYTQEQLDKLPKWAQTEIKTLEMNRKSLEQRLLQFQGKAETNTYVRYGLDRIPILNNATVEFKTGLNQLNTVSVYVRADGIIDVNTDSRIGQEMVIATRAANSFYIKFIDNKYHYANNTSTTLTGK